MLDLSALNDKCYEIKLLDGTELQLGRPTQAMTEFIAQMQKIAKAGDELETIRALSSLFARILNKNKNGIKFKAEELAEVYDTQVIRYVIEDYFDFWNKDVLENVAFQQNQ